MRTGIPKGRLALAVGVGLALSLVAAACGKDNNPTGNPSGGSGGSGGSGALTGSIVVSGSSTVQPISELVAQAFSNANSSVNVSVDGPGTGDGFTLFCQGQTDVSDASRPIKDEEKTACQQGGINYIELKIGLDGITVMTSNDNTGVNCLSKADLYALIGPESEGFKNWSDADSLDKELGGTGTFPSTPLDLIGPGQESGTYDAFIELALKSIADARSQTDTATRPDYQSSPNDNVIIQGIEGSSSSLGWVGFAYAEENAQGLKILGVSPAEDASGEGSSDCVTPDRTTIADGTYPLSRSLYIYVNTDKAKTNAALKSFVSFYLQGMKDFVSRAGYVDLPDDQIAATESAWTTAGF
jgi:phosphate transport system substrate-binding protein